MGFFAIYTAVFMLAAIVLMDFTPERRVESEYDQAAALGMQMAAWHQAAVTHCSIPANCPSGGISLGTILPDMPNAMAGGDIYAHGDFNSASDGVNVLVTWYRASNGRRSNDGMLVTALTKVYGWNVVSGFYDAARQQVDRGRVLALDNPLLAQAQVPQSIGGVTIPDGAPIIVTRF